jgi:hypothetical protein
MKISRMKIAAVLALIIGAMAIFAGGRVLLGVLPDYYVIDWLPIYNFTVGVITVFVTAVLLWKSHRLAKLAAVITFIAHGLVMAILLVFYGAVVASDSLAAMSARGLVWAAILSLLFVQPRVSSTSSV